MKKQTLIFLMFGCFVFLGQFLGFALGSGTFYSEPFYWDNRDGKLMTGSHRVSPTATEEDIGILQVDGAYAKGWTANTPTWDTSMVEDGWHELLLDWQNVTEKVLVLNGSEVVIHGGVLEEDQVWAADVVHVVRNWVRIPEGKRLVIPNGAVVKFCQGTGIQNDGMLSAMSATLTAFEDDTASGYTNLDGDEHAPINGCFAIPNNGTLSVSDCIIKYATSDSVIATETIAEGAFANCPELTKVVISPYVTTIASGAFSGDALEEVTFNGILTDVDPTAFEGTEIQNVRFPGGFPVRNYIFGDSKPVIHFNSALSSDEWYGYEVVDDAATQASEQAELVQKMDALMEILQGGEAYQVLTKGADGTFSWQPADVGADVMTISLEEGWNLVAMPGSVLMDESSQAMLNNVEVFTYDKKTQSFNPAEGLEPLTSYWMRAKEPCVIHFLVIDEK